MAARALALAVALTSALALLAAPVPAPAATLSHAGRWITDAQGRVVVLHGLNMVAKRPPYTPASTGFGDDDAAFLAAAGFDAVRVGVIDAAVEPSPGVYDDGYLDAIAQTVDVLGRHGIVSVLDFHQDLYNERFQGEGFPDWAVIDDGLPASPQYGFPENYLRQPATQHAFDHFWANDPAPDGTGLQDHFAAAWAHVAARFARDPHVAGYELLNEPFPGSGWKACLVSAGCPGFDGVLRAFTRRAIAGVRAADPSTLVLYEPNVLFNSFADTRIGDIGDARAVFAFHDYCELAGQLGSDKACRAADDRVFANAERQSRRTGDGLLLTEFGATRDLRLLREMAERADRTRIGWLEWHYCACEDPTTSGPGAEQALVLDPSRPPAGANVEAAKLRVLARPYPRAVAGTPEAWSFTASGGRRFALRYATRRADGRGAFGAGAVTEVVLPRLQYPRGYRVRVRGARVASAPGAPLLRLAAVAGARRVSVRVSAR